MKKVLKILLMSVISIITALSMVACASPTDPDGGKTGLLYKKENSTGYYVITGYKDDGTNQDTLTVDVSNEEELIRIKKGAFSGNDTIKHLIISGDVDEIEAGAFENMISLETLEIPFVGQYANADATFAESGSADEDKKAIGSARTISHFFGSSYYGGGATTTIKYKENDSETETTCYVPAKLNKIIVNAPSEYKIPMDAFNGLSGPDQTLSIEIKGNVVAIGERAFKGTGISDITVPATVKTIYKNAFEGCVLLSNVKFESGAANIVLEENVFNGCKKMNAIDATADLTVNFEKFSSVDDGAFDFGKENVKYTVNNGTSFDLDKIFGLTEYQN